MRSLNEVAEAALDLPERDRAALAERLLESLEMPESTDEEFVRTILARSEALDRGETTASDWREAIARMRSRLEGEIPKVDRGG
jgi:hypothetical protein